MSGPRSWGFHTRIAVATAVAVVLHSGAVVVGEHIRPPRIVTAGLASFLWITTWAAIAVGARAAARRGGTSVQRITLACFATGATYVSLFAVQLLTGSPAPGLSVPGWFRLVWGVLPPVVAGLVIAVRPAPAGAVRLHDPAPRTATARRVFRRRVRRAVVIGLAAHVAAVAIGRAYLIWYHRTHPCPWCGDDLSNFDLELAIRTAVVVPLSYIAGLTAMFSAIRRAEVGFADSTLRFAMAVIAAVITTLVAAAAMPFAMAAGPVAMWTWVVLALIGPPLFCGLPYLIDTDIRALRVVDWG